jgi:transposase
MKSELSDSDLLQLSESAALELARKHPELGAWALLQLSALKRSQQACAAAALSTPSAQIAPYEKPSAKKRARKRGRKAGHEGVRRAAPPEIDERLEHTLERCPDCGGPVGPARSKRRRVIEDIDEARVTATEHTIGSHYCPQCKKRVEPRVAEALPRSTVGNRAVVLSSWLHYGLGQSLSQIVSVFDSLFHFPISAGGLTQQWARIGAIFSPWYEQIAEEARAGAVLQADETGWRIEGRTHWLWCFTNPWLSYYVIDPSRSSRVVHDFLKETYAGTLVSDFFSAYNLVAAEGRQVCFAHLLRELAKVDLTNGSEQWLGFRRTLYRILQDAMRLARRADREAPDFASKRKRIEERMDALLAAANREDPDAHRIAQRLRKHRAHLFPFLYNPLVPFDNNRAEREIRPAVIARKNSLHNTSQNGAKTQALLLSIYRTLKLRGLDPLQSIAQALTTYIASDKLPPLPKAPDP